MEPLAFPAENATHSMLDLRVREFGDLGQMVVSRSSIATFCP
jgi:hypothetical protein